MDLVSLGDISGMIRSLSSGDRRIRALTVGERAMPARDWSDQRKFP